jgi:hypothetical protein
MSIHPWHAMPRWKKKLSGFFSYLAAAIFALFNPESTDRAMYEILAEQFNEKTTPRLDRLKIMLSYEAHPEYGAAATDAIEVQGTAKMLRRLEAYLKHRNPEARQ